MSLRDIFQVSLENRDEAIVDDDSIKNPLVDGFVPEHNIIFHGNLESGEWETIIQESYKPFKVWNFLNGVGTRLAQPSLETLQLQEHSAELTEEFLQESTQVYVLPEADLGLSVQEEYLTAALNNPENSVVVSKDPNNLAVDSLRSKGIAVVTSLEDAALYIATAC